MDSVLKCFNEVLTWHSSEKMQFLCMFVLPGSAETLFRWGENISQLLIAQSLSNVCAKNYKTRMMLVQVTAKNVRDGFLGGHSV